MSFFSGVLNFLMFMFFIRVVFTILTATRGLFKPKAKVRQQDAPKSHFLEAIEASQAFEAVTDENCGMLVPKNEAYIVMGEDGPRYFCSWDCRQEYIAKKRSEET